MLLLVGHPFRICTYENNPINAQVIVAINIVGVQKKTILRNLLSSRLAPQNNAEPTSARSQNPGENSASANLPASTAIPVAFSALISLNAMTSPGPIRASTIPPTPLNTPLT